MIIIINLGLVQLIDVDDDFNDDDDSSDERMMLMMIVVVMMMMMMMKHGREKRSNLIHLSDIWTIYLYWINIINDYYDDDDTEVW